MTTLPRGVVTFLMTDVEASTRRWEQEPDEMRDAMLRHDVLFDSAVERHAGVIVKPRGEGDSRFAVFPNATDAVAAATESQQAFYSEHWATQDPIRVRMAMHTGEADLRDGDYYGSTVNRCARLRSLASGGQSLISLATAQLVRERLPQGVSLRDLGQHRLKDLSWPEHVFQLVIPGVENEFPPLQSLDLHPTNLPVQASTFIGREHEMESLRECLLDPTARLITLTGPGGSGKTRLGLQVAASVVDAFPDGVYFVPLEAVRDPELIIQSIVQSVGVRETESAGLGQALDDFLREKQILLVLDNFDRLIPGARHVADLLATHPLLKILVTSRQFLNLRGEREVFVPPLGLPDPGTTPPVEELLQYEAVRLFVQRAQDINPAFELTRENAATVLAICRRLDGLPLALELAAARIRLFQPQQLLKRLDRRLPLLTGGPQDLPARQQTLRDTIAWSHDLLTESEQGLFRRLAVFDGGFGLDAAVAISAAIDSSPDRSGVESVPVDPWLMSFEVLEGLEGLANKSLLRPVRIAEEDGDDPRFAMLETIREFGQEQLERFGELADIRRAHAAHFLRLAETAEPELQGPDQGTWLRHLELEHGNLRAAMTYALDARDADLGLRLTSNLWPFWEVRGYFTEGRNWTERMLLLGGEPEWRARTLTGAGTMAWSQGDYPQASAYHQEALALYEQVGDEVGIGFALSNLGLQSAGQGDLARATELFQEAEAHYQRIANLPGIADVLQNMAMVAFYEHDLDRAASLVDESLTIRRRLGDKQRIADALYNLGEIAYYRKDYDRAAALYRESLSARRELGARSGAALCLAALAGVSAAQGDLERGARLCGAAEVLFESTGISMDPSERTRYEAIAQRLREELGESTYSRLREEGRQFLVEEAIDYALTGMDPERPSRNGASSSLFSGRGLPDQALQD